MRGVEDVIDLGCFVPAMPDKSRHHVISRGQAPRFYRPQDLRDIGQGKTAWVDSFEKILTGLFWVIEKPVPYAFRTPNRNLRSLDAGCIRMLLNRRPPDLVVECDEYGFIETVAPSQRLIDLYEPLRQQLIQRTLQATAED